MLSTRPLLAAVALSTLSALTLTAQAVTPATAQTLPSGVVVTHLTAGSGAQPTASSVVKVHYEGKLKDGTVFDSSYKRGSPAVFPLNRVIPCWTEGVQTLKVGGKALLQCPAKTAYGASGAGGVIPPNADLTFTVELLAIES